MKGVIIKLLNLRLHKLWSPDSQKLSGHQAATWGQLEEAAPKVSPFSTGAASWGVVGLSDDLQAMGNRVVPSAAHEDHAVADTLRGPATASIGAS